MWSSTHLECSVSPLSGSMTSLRIRSRKSANLSGLQRWTSSPITCKQSCGLPNFRSRTRHHVDADQDLDPTFHLDADPDSGSNPVLQMLEKKLLPFTPVPFYVVLSFCHPHWCHNIQYFEQNIKIY